MASLVNPQNAKKTAGNQDGTTRAQNLWKEFNISPGSFNIDDDRVYMEVSKSYGSTKYQTGDDGPLPSQQLLQEASQLAQEQEGTSIEQTHLFQVWEIHLPSATDRADPNITTTIWTPSLREPRRRWD